MQLSTILKRSLGVFLVVVQGFVAGLLLNFLWYLFHNLILGWGDSGPGWYAAVQDYVFYGLLLVGLIGWAVIYWCLYRYLDRKEKMEGSGFPRE